MKTQVSIDRVLILVTVLGGVLLLPYVSAFMTNEKQIYSSGTINYITAPKLHAEGRWLKDPDGNIVQLVGFAGGVQTMGPSPVGLWERSGSSQHYDWNFDEQAIVQNLDAMKAAGANTIRSHLAMWFIKNDGIYVDGKGLVQLKESYYRMIDLAGRRGIYVIIEGMTVTPDFLGGGSQDALPYPPYQDAEPDQILAREVIPDKQAFIDLWLQLALHLKDLPNVIFEPWNEPHAPAGYDETALRDEWFGVVRDLVAAFRANGIDHPIVLHWGYGLYVNWNVPDDPQGKMNWVIQANATVNDPLRNLIFSTHLYRTGGAFGVYRLGQARQEYDDVKLAMQLELIEYNAVNLSFPLVVGEIGASTLSDPENESLALANALQVLNEWKISWLAYWWRTGSQWTLFSSETYILSPVPNFNTNGLIVRDALIASAVP